MLRRCRWCTSRPDTSLPTTGPLRYGGRLCRRDDSSLVARRSGHGRRTAYNKAVGQLFDIDGHFFELFGHAGYAVGLLAACLGEVEELGCGFGEGGLVGGRKLGPFAATVVVPETCVPDIFEKTTNLQYSKSRWALRNGQRNGKISPLGLSILLGLNVSFAGATRPRIEARRSRA